MTATHLKITVTLAEDFFTQMIATLIELDLPVSMTSKTL